MASGEETKLYCICKETYDKTRFMIECDVCNDWFHGTCVDIQEHQAVDIESYHCPACQQTHGPLLLKAKRSHRKKYDYSEDGEFASKCGTVRFLKGLKTKKFTSADKVVKKLRGYQLDLDYIDKHGFSSPIIVHEKDGLDLVVPPSNFTVDDVELAVGSMRELDVIDVSKQSDLKMLMREWVQYYNNPKRDRILNVISLEFSSTGLSAMVTPPRIITELSWVTNYWPDHTGDVRTFIRPEVQKYCLMSVKDSYTDFHVDFGGTSVWYHIIRGAKIFYLIEPTPANIALYETWTSSSEQNDIFFGDQVPHCHKLVIRQGDTLFIPTGWIHAVYTPEDSLVFGGNFLHNYNIGLQLEIYDIERRINTPERFLFPNFETTCWYAAKHLADLMKDYVDEGRELCNFVRAGCYDLAERLQDWTKPHQHPQDLRRHKDYMPEGISNTKLLKQLYSLIEQLQASSTSSIVQTSRCKSPGKIKPIKISKAKAKKHSKRRLSDKTDRKSNVAKDKAAQSSTVIEKLSDDCSLHNEESKPAIGLKMKFAGGNLLKQPATQSDTGSDSETEQLVVDDNPTNPVKYRFSLGGRNIQDLSSQSASEDLMSDNARSPAKPIKSENRQVAWSMGIENLIKASTLLKDKKSASSSVPQEKFSSLLVSTQATPLRLGTSLPEVVFKVRKPDEPVQSAIISQQDDEDQIKSCYKDDTYVYPTLADSDDEEVKPPKKRKSNRDDAWCPKTKVRALPSDFTERPRRPNARRESVEQGLKMASEHLQNKPEKKRQYVKKIKVSGKQQLDSEFDNAVASTSSGGHDLTSSAPATMLHMRGKDSGKEVKRTKKGLATTKQRLGKLLKIHKMGY